MTDAIEPQEPRGKPLFFERNDNRIRALLIDPFEKQLVQGWIEKGLAAMYETIGCDAIDTACIGQDSDGVTVDLVFDDAGRCKTGQRCFRIGDCIIVGRALVLGSDRNGETTSTGLTLSQLRREIAWVREDQDYSPTAPTIIVI